MTEFLFEGDLLEFPKESDSPSCIITPELYDFITGFLLGDGEIVFNTCRCLTPFENFALWLKDCFERFDILGFVKYLPVVKSISLKKAGKPAMWQFETETYGILEPFQKRWYRHNCKKIFNFKITPLTLFFWYLNCGYCYEFKGTNYLTIQDKEMLETLKKLGITNIASRRNDVLIKAPSQEKFFSYILSHDYPIPDCRKRLFPPEYLEGHPIFIS